jgi:tRNA U54 and U55 pseudouridine synthase Pus10
MPVSKSPRECSVEDALVKSVEAIGGVALKLEIAGVRGFPDRTLFLPGGRVIVVEVKRPRGGRLSQHQMRWLHRLQALGVEVAVVRNLRDVAALCDLPNRGDRG